MKGALLATAVAMVLPLLVGARGAAADADLHPLYPGQRGLSPVLERTAGASSAPETSPNGTPQARGAVLYDTHCITCHGANLRGTGDGPALQQSGGAGVDFFLTTGRMPLNTTGVQGWHTKNVFTPEQTDDLEAYVDAHVAQSIPIPNVHVDPALLARGRYVFEQDCQACHGAAAQGADAGFGWIAVPLDAATARQIGEAVRIGPGVMPVFTRAELSDDDVNALATYIAYMTTTPPNPGGTPFGFLGPLAEGAIAWFIGIGGLFFVIYFTGTTTRAGRRLPR